MSRDFAGPQGPVQAPAAVSQPTAPRRAAPTRPRRSASVSRGRLLAYRALFGLALLALWQAASGRLIDPFWVSSPSRVAAFLWQLIRDGSIWGHLSVTLYETATGFVIGAVAGVGAGFLLAPQRTLAQVLDPYIVAFNGIPRIALAPLFIIWFGIGPNSKVVLVVTVVFFLTFFNTYSGVRGVEPEYVNVLRIMGATRRQILWKVTIPATVPWITTGLKISVPYAIVGAIVGEFIAASRGLGYLINYYTGLFSTTGALAGIIIVALIVVLSSEAINYAEAYLLRWRPAAEGRPEREIY